MFFILVSSLATFVSIWYLIKHPSRLVKRRVLGYIGWVDLLIHACIISMFIGNAAALIAAEIAGIGVSIYLRGMRREIGLQRLERRGLSFVWVSYTVAEWDAKVADKAKAAEQRSVAALARAEAPKPRAPRKAAPRKAPAKAVAKPVAKRAPRKAAA